MVQILCPLAYRKNEFRLCALGVLHRTLKSNFSPILVQKFWAPLGQDPCLCFSVSCCMNNSKYNNLLFISDDLRNLIFRQIFTTDSPTFSTSGEKEFVMLIFCTFITLLAYTTESPIDLMLVSILLGYWNSLNKSWSVFPYNLLDYFQNS